MQTKTKIFNLALNALLLSKRLVNADTDTGNEAVTLRTNWDIAWESALEDMDLNRTCSRKTLEQLAEDPNSLWLFHCRRPTDCAFIRRIVSGVRTDNRSSRILFETGIHEGQDGIFTNEDEAVIEYISTETPIGALSAKAALAVAYNLAIHASPLIVGKGAANLRKEIEAKYLMAKADAQEADARENFQFEDDETQSEFVAERLGV